MARYSPSRISAVVLPLSWVGIALIGLPQTRSQDWSLGWEVWVLLVFATLGPLVITNILWFHSLDRIGASRATLATNLQPFAAAICAVVLLGETIDVVQIAGGVLIAVGILAARRRSPVSPGEYGESRSAQYAARMTMSPQRRTALVSVGAAVALMGIKLGTGLASSSLGLISEALHSGTDLVAALLTFFAIGVAGRPADRSHPYGHGKAEHLAALAEAGVLLLVSVAVRRLASRASSAGSRSRRPPRGGCSPPSESCS